mmetsp:Transcript_14758/g.26590  ORF Transcript_14758/g.26590 Transcript_14758/m.26590 type:complete len:685 (-) Transcript_14758:53-2107(-)
MLVMALVRWAGLLVAGMCLHRQQAAAFQTEMAPMEPLRADLDHHFGKIVYAGWGKNTTASAVHGNRSKRNHTGEGFIHKMWRLSSKGAPALPDVLPYNEAQKHRRKHKVRTEPSQPQKMYEALRKAPEDKPATTEADPAAKRVSEEDIDITSTPGMRVVDALLLVSFGVFAVNSFGDLRNFWYLMRGEKLEDPVRFSGGRTEDPGTWSTTMLVGLTAYRFYTGFLTATWLPYLLAMEGQYLWSSNQSMFMGCAKLIYGATILTNPILGLVGDRAVLLSHGIGRRLFVRIGVALAGLGILICMIAAVIEYFYTFMFGIFVWRMGEAINDVTTEALVPELVPAEQFQIASAVKAAMFLFGGLFGYLLLILAARIHYSWLYYAYLCGMIVTCIPVLILLDNDAPRVPSSSNRRQEHSFSTEMVEAYLAPARAEGGFPRACLAVFIFSLGTAPMFFLLLIVRDVVGIKDPVALQEHFSGSSIMFFVSAALAAVLSGAGPPRPPSANPSAQRLATQEPEAAEDSHLIKSIVRMAISVTTFALLCFGIPYVALLPQRQARLIIFYVTAAVFGYTFGLSFSQFQGITWQLLPPGIDLANAMGFNVMSRLLGLGVGNFIAGLILDFFYVDTGDDALDDFSSGGYGFIGYVTMCTASGIATLIAAALSYSIAVKYRAEAETSRKTGVLIAAAG